MNQRVRDSINKLYSQSESVSPPTSVYSCENCHEEAEERHLVSTPLREISPKILSVYAAAQPSCVGGADLTYFLPRILECLVEDPDWWPEPEIVCRNLAEECGYLEFGANQSPIADALEAVFDDLLTRKQNSGAAIGKWICALGIISADIRPFLNKLLDPRFGSKLLEYDLSTRSVRFQRKFGSAHWNEVNGKPNSGRMEKWLQSNELKEAFERAGGKFEDG